MAGNSISGSFPHSFHQGRGGGSTGGWNFQSRGLQKPHETSRQTTTYRQTSKHRKSKENADPQPPQIGHTWHKSALSARLSGSTYGFCTCHAKRTQRRNLGIHNRVSFAIFLGSCLGRTFPMAVVSCFGNGAHEHATRPSLSCHTLGRHHRRRRGSFTASDATSALDG